MNKTGEIYFHPIFKGDDDHVSSLTQYMDRKCKTYRGYKSKETWGRFFIYAYDPTGFAEEYFDGRNGIDYTLGLNKEKKPKDFALLPIRMPGKTIGYIKVNKEMLIMEVKVYDDGIKEFDELSFDRFTGKEVVIVKDNELLFTAGGLKNTYTSKLTREMDTYIIGGYPEDMFTEGYTYLDYPAVTENESGKLIYLLRAPGATRGNIVVNKDTLLIEEISLIESTTEGFYKPEIKEILNNYIDKRINIRNWRG